jgi:septal ring factor EnvC (AmiA/AmiB activator)
MDVERTMEFILEQQAKSAVWQQKTDRKMAGIQKLVVTGMKMLVKHDRDQAEFRKELLALKKEMAEQKREMAEQAKRTDKRVAQGEAKFERLIAALLRQRPNGRH